MFQLCRFLPFALAILTTQSAADAHPPAAYPQDGPVQVAGEIEVVFDWTHDRCDDDHIPGLPVRAFCDGTGRISLILSHHEARRMTGTDFRDLQVECAPLMTSARNPDAEMFSNHEWIAARGSSGRRSMLSCTTNTRATATPDVTAMIMSSVGTTRSPMRGPMAPGPVSTG